MKEKRIRRCLPCEWYETGAAEHWLGDLAKAGWQLEGMNSIWAVFRKAEPQSCRYRFYPKRFDPETADGREQAFFQEMGWEYVCTIKREFTIFRCADENAPELCTDPVVEAESYRKLDKKLRQEILCLAAYPFFYLFFSYLINWIIFARRAHRWLSLIHLFAGGFEICLALLFFFLVGVAGAARRFRQVHALRERLALGEPADHAVPYPRRRLLSAQEFWNGLALGILLLLLVWVSQTGRQPLAEAAAPVPAVVLLDLEKDAASKGPAWLEARATLLSECFGESNQLATVEGGLIWLNCTYIRVRFPQLAEPVFDSLAQWKLEEELQTTHFWESTQVQPSPQESRFDEVLCYEQIRRSADGAAGARAWTAVVRRGKQILYVQYTGKQPLEPLFDELDRTLRRFEEGA